MKRRIFDETHDAFRAVARSFVQREVLPNLARWDEAGVVDRDLWRKAGEVGLLGLGIEECYGGSATADYRYHVVWNEELARAGTLSPALNLHSEVVGGCLDRFCTPEQKRRWLPGLCAGTSIWTMAITEPAAGSDVAAIQTTARRDGEEYVVNGQKAFVSHGTVADFVVVLARLATGEGPAGTGPPQAVLLVVDTGASDVTIGRKEAKIGLRSLDTVPLFLQDTRVPATHRLGEEGFGFLYLLDTLARERLSISVSALAFAERLYEETVEHCHRRRVYGAPLCELQHVRFTLAELATELAAARAFTDACIIEHNEGELSTEEASMVKWWNTELCGRVADRCLQLHGGMGYSSDLLVGRAFVDSRAQRIYGGSTETLKEVIGQSI
ncbi:MAG TPA: acyl-CoA dehydrogenase family protein [Streptosporangiaceae bacterium]|nr:acyl-CoA dehydrogenase family protein [Streptosporangiaceae bacterium]